MEINPAAVLGLIASLYQQVAALSAENEQLRSTLAQKEDGSA